VFIRNSINRSASRFDSSTRRQRAPTSYWMAVSETSCCLVFRIPDMDKLQNLNNSDCYTLSSESCGFYQPIVDRKKSPLCSMLHFTSILQNVITKHSRYNETNCCSPVHDLLHNLLSYSMLTLDNSLLWEQNSPIFRAFILHL
jgi:hypothetical protein